MTSRADRAQSRAHISIVRLGDGGMSPPMARLQRALRGPVLVRDHPAYGRRPIPARAGASGRSAGWPMPWAWSRPWVREFGDAGM